MLYHNTSHIVFIPPVLFFKIILTLSLVNKYIRKNIFVIVPSNPIQKRIFYTKIFPSYYPKLHKQLSTSFSHSPETNFRGRFPGGVPTPQKINIPQIKIVSSVRHVETALNVSSSFLVGGWSEHTQTTLEVSQDEVGAGQTHVGRWVKKKHVGAITISPYGGHIELRHLGEGAQTV